MRKQFPRHFLIAHWTFTARESLYLRLKLASGLMKKRKKKGGRRKKKFSIQLQRQSLDLNVEVLMGVRCAFNQRNMAGNVTELKQEEMRLQELW